MATLSDAARKLCLCCGDKAPTLVLVFLDGHPPLLGPRSATALFPRLSFTSILTRRGRSMLNLGGRCLTMFFAETAGLTPLSPALSCFGMCTAWSALAVSYIPSCKLVSDFPVCCLSAGNAQGVQNIAYACNISDQSRHFHAEFYRQYTRPGRKLDACQSRPSARRQIPVS